MIDIWQYFQNLFQKAEQSSKTQPLMHDPIVRSPKEQIAFEQWKHSFVKDQLLNWLTTEYEIYLKDGSAQDSSLTFLNTVSLKGFAIHFSKLRYTSKEVTHLFDYFKEKILETNYRSYSSDVRTYMKGSVVESMARHYLKPSLKNMLGNPPFNQEFGNISIELICQDDLPKILKFSSTSYNDRSYQKPKHFEELMKHLLH